MLRETTTLAIPTGIRIPHRRKSRSPHTRLTDILITSELDHPFQILINLSLKDEIFNETSRDSKWCHHRIPQQIKSKSLHMIDTIVSTYHLKIKLVSLSLSFPLPFRTRARVRASSRRLFLDVAPTTGLFPACLILVYILRLRSPVGTVHVVTVSLVPCCKRAVTVDLVAAEDLIECLPPIAIRVSP